LRLYSDRLFGFSMEFCITSLDRIILNPGINYTIGVAQLDCLLGFTEPTTTPIYNQFIIKKASHFKNGTGPTSCS